MPFLASVLEPFCCCVGVGPWVSRDRQTCIGYTRYLLAAPPRYGRDWALCISVSTKGRRVTYYVPATVTETTMQADLGQLGAITLSFQPAH
jgi:hypothetical protein